MAETLTDAEIAKLRTLISAYDEGQQVDDLPLADTSNVDKEIEVFDTVSGVSQRMGLCDAVDMANAPYAGRKWKKNNATTKAAGWVGSLETLRNIQSVLGLGCYLVKNDHSRRKLDASNHYLFATGEAAKLDGSMGHYDWGWGKPFYLAFWEDDNYEYEAFSLYPIKGKYNYYIPIGSCPAAGFSAYDRTNSTLVNYINDDAQYRGGNNTSSWDDTYRSLLGRPVTALTTDAGKTAAHKNGDGWMNGSVRMYAIIQILIEIVMGERNSQATYNASKDDDGLYQGGFGTGVTTINSTAWSNYFSYNPFLHLSTGVELGDAIGISNVEVNDADSNLLYTAPVPVFFGLKNFFGYLWRQSEDELAEANEDKSMNHWVTPSIYGSYTYGSTTGMVKKSTSAIATGFIVKRSIENLELWPTQTGGSNTTYYADYFWNNSGITSGFRAVFRGASASYGGNAGGGAVNVNNAVTNANANYGSPLNNMTYGDKDLAPWRKTNYRRKHW